MNKKPNTPNSTPTEQQNDLQDEAFFSQYLQGNSLLSKLQRNMEAPEPSEQLNQTILAAAQKEADRNHWWSKPGSWAATVAIISLVGLLTHNTWQEEQKPFREKMEQSSFSAPQPSAETKTRSKALIEPLSRSEGQKDSRKLIYKSAPAPVLPAAPGRLLSKQADAVLSEGDMDAIHSLSSQPSQASPAKRKASAQEQPVLESFEEKSTRSMPQGGKSQDTFSDEQQWLLKITQLLENNQIEEARQLLVRFTEKYPDYPIDPVILQRLSLY